MIAKGIRFPTYPNNSQDTALANEGSFIKIHNNTWYLFYRESNYAASPSYCSQAINVLFRIMVVYSTNNGQTWSKPAIVAEPVANSYSECSIVDGSAYYDEELNIWHYIGQCIARSGGWTMCHYYANNTSNPWYDMSNINSYNYNSTTVWVANSANPVVTGGELFGQICNLNGSHCGPNTVDEGTPDIIGNDKTSGNYYFVSFHGYDYINNLAVRSIALVTLDFKQWKMKSYYLPNDAIYSRLDCNDKLFWNITWDNNTGCVGGGEGTMVKSGDYYYHLIETMDIALTCDTTYGQQNWVLALLRSPSLYWKSGQWQQMEMKSGKNGEPTVVPWEKYGCGLQYHRIFKDENETIYMALWINNFVNGYNEMQIFKLVDFGTNSTFHLPLVITPSQ